MARALDIFFAILGLGAGLLVLTLCYAISFLMLAYIKGRARGGE